MRGKDAYIASKLAYDIDPDVSYGSYVPMLLKFDKTAKAGQQNVGYEIRVTKDGDQLALKDISIVSASRNQMQIRSYDSISTIARATKRFIKKTSVL